MMKCQSAPIVLWAVFLLSPAPSLYSKELRKIAEFPGWGLPGEAAVRLDPQAADATGAILGPDFRSSSAFEIREGRIVHVFEASGMGAVQATFGPDRLRYLLFSGSEGVVLRKYGPDGRIVDSIPCPQMLDLPKALAVGPDGSLAVYSFPERPTAEAMPLIQRFDSNCLLTERQYYGKPGDRAAGALLFFAEKGEIALYRPDEGVAVWLDSDGGIVASMEPAEGDWVSAVALVEDELWVVVQKGAEIEMNREGVRAMRIAGSDLYRINRSGERRVLALPPEAAAIGQITREGDLIRVSRNDVTVFRLER